MALPNRWNEVWVVECQARRGTRWRPEYGLAFAGHDAQAKAEKEAAIWNEAHEEWFRATRYIPAPTKKPRRKGK